MFNLRSETKLSLFLLRQKYECNGSFALEGEILVVFKKDALF